MGHCAYKAIACVLLTATCLGQSSQSPTDRPPTGQAPQNVQPSGTPAANQRPANRDPNSPESLEDASRAAKQAKQNAPPLKVIKNHDLTEDAAAPIASSASPANAKPAQSQLDQDKGKAEAFEAQGKIYQNQVKVQKGRIVDLENRVRSLNDQFYAWMAEYEGDVDPNVCWTSGGDTYYFKSWCDVGRSLRACEEAAQRQLGQEKNRLDEMQESIRRKGYGNAVYDPD